VRGPFLVIAMFVSAYDVFRFVRDFVAGEESLRNLLMAFTATGAIIAVFFSLP